jgi:2',3'-cyclic-nucleotide 2'-phosphodiesterase (5'-nucleotidase family)
LGFLKKNLILFSKQRTLLILTLSIAFISCNRLPFTHVTKGHLQTLDSNWTHTNEKIESLIGPYKAQIDSQMNAVIGYSSSEMIKSRPESALGNGVADLLYNYGADNIDSDIDLCVLNYGGLRAPISKGPITVGRVFELMPFDNTLVVVTLDGDELKVLAKHILAQSGEPFAASKPVNITNFKSGALFIFSDTTLQSKSEYKVLTSNYLADGGDNFSMFKDQPRTDSNILIRQALIEGFSRTNEENPFKAIIDGRIIWDPNKHE